MEVKNYYLLSEEELMQSLHTIRNWLFDFSKHERKAKAEFALDVALDAEKARMWDCDDEFLKLVLEHLF